MDFILSRIAQTIREEYSACFEKVEKNEYGRMFYYYIFENVRLSLEVDEHYIYIRCCSKGEDPVQMFGMQVSRQGDLLVKLDYLRAIFEMSKKI